MSRTNSEKNKSGRKTLTYIVTAVTSCVVLAIIAVFSIAVYRTLVSVKADNADSEYRYGDIYYNALDYRMQYLYDSIVISAENHEEMTSVIPHYYTEQEFERVIRYIKADKPELFWIELDKSEFIFNEHKCRVKLKYAYSFENTEKMKENLASKLESVKQAALSETDGTDSELLLWLHDYIVVGCRAELNGDHASRTAYGALVNGKASADGYSAAYKLLCDELDIYCLSVYGRVYSTDHMWNLVWDGRTYRHVDVMWDDPDIEYIPELVSHAYYGLSDSEIERDHMIIRKSLIPDAVSDSVYYTENELCAESNNADRVLRIMIEECIKSGGTHFEFATDIPYDMLEKITEETVSVYETLSGHRLYRLSEQDSVYALQIFFE